MGALLAVSPLPPAASLERLARASGGRLALTVMGGIPGRLMGVVRGTRPAWPEGCPDVLDQSGSPLGVGVAVLGVGVGAVLTGGRLSLAFEAPRSTAMQAPSPSTVWGNVAVELPATLGAVSWTGEKPSSLGCLPGVHAGAAEPGLVGMRWR